ncbi:beta-eliminating lyase-related protein [Intrasporangium calvum]|uniref:Beta-eliminating lyase-related protein n=1 Tax=Intrasporangium calvum TaxID=53358 RepID=A0ABT5GEQ0_9MICO|nr:beta-eliminating lyase-related protein [Intrasporangium calvum]
MTVAAVRADLLSDTVTRPGVAMREAMATAVVGDDVFGEDPTVRELEDRVAGLLGHEAGLFTPTGSMANQLGVRLHVKPGEELVGDSLAHVLRAELGAAAILSGISSRTWVSQRGRFRADDAASLMITGVGPYQVCTALVIVENTHNFGGGTIQPLEEIQRARQLTRERGVAMHLDGARLWNAHVATGVPLDAYGREFDTVSVCLSKGLGAPVGSVLVGSREAMAEARVWRKRFGGGMRQAGILAAAGLWALDHHIDRLSLDHGRARRAAEAMAAAVPGSVDLSTVETNIVIVDVAVAGWSGADFVAAALARGVRTYAVGPGAVRLVWHLEVDDDATDHAVEVLTALLAEGPAASVSA